MITAQHVKEKLTIDALGMYLHNFPAEQVIATAEDDFANGPSVAWEVNNIIASYLQDVFRGTYFVVDLCAVYASPVPLDPKDPLSTCQKILLDEGSEYTWIILLLRMCNGVAAGCLLPVGITVAQVEAFLRLARDIDRDFVSH